MTDGAIVVLELATFGLRSITEEATAVARAGLRSTMLGLVGSLGDDLPSVNVGVPDSESVALARLLTVRGGMRASLNFEVFGFVSVAVAGGAAAAEVEVDGAPSSVGVATAVRSPSSSTFALSLLFSGAPYAASKAFTSASDLSSIVAPTFSTSPLLIAFNHLLAFAFSSSSPKSSMSSSSDTHGGATSLSFSSSLPVRMAWARGCVVEDVEEEVEGRMEAPRDWEGVLRGRVVL